MQPRFKLQKALPETEIDNNLTDATQNHHKRNSEKHTLTSCPNIHKAEEQDKNTLMQVEKYEKT